MVGLLLFVFTKIQQGIYRVGLCARRPCDSIASPLFGWGQTGAATHPVLTGFCPQEIHNQGEGRNV